MRHDLNYENFLVARPLWAVFEEDRFGIPKMWETKLTKEKASFAEMLNYRHAHSIKDIANYIIEQFTFDFDLGSVWRNPFTGLKRLRSAAAVLGPDFSITPSMKEAQIIESTFKNRWMCCFYQEHSVDAIATASWAEPWTYEICIQGMREGNPFAVSTIGVKDRKMFLDGFSYFARKLKPAYVICYGKPIEGMWGSIISFAYKEAWRPDKHAEQLKLFPVTRCQEITREGC